jgi:hypothetical protein
LAVSLSSGVRKAGGRLRDHCFVCSFPARPQKLLPKMLVEKTTNRLGLTPCLAAAIGLLISDD